MKQKSQPKGMYILAFTEVFERLSYYTLSFLLVLYASATVENKGLGWSNERALALVGLYTMAAYTLPILGSFIADRFIGRYKAVILGGFVIILGHFLLFFSDYSNFFYIGLACVASGTGFFKPCMPALLGQLYSPDDLRRESGFSWYYFGINLGAMIAGISSGLLLQHFGFRVALASAGVGMIFGMIVFFAGRKHLVLDKVIRKSKHDEKNHQPITRKQKKALISLLIAFVFFAIWAIIYNIAISGTLTLFIENQTNKTLFNYNIPATFFQSLESLTIISSTPVITYFLAKMALRNKYPHFFTQMNFALLLCSISLFYFSYLAYIGQNSLTGEKPFQYYEIAFFIILFSVSETVISPVMMSAISLIAPMKLKSLFQAFYLATFGLTGIIAAKIGAISLEFPFKTFLTLSFILLIGTVLYFFLKGKMIKTAMEAAKEQAALHYGSKK
ncbi:peptide MFS transporter [Fluviispira sanaruensis]|uniref:MFS transporter n=1 Tax=Fluviispira sanaruensis TaxID=2493639 RepID=A0A4P2VTJ8_FLUSA|nr:peptide MFS transporter [Fluviispira sanaruensis]BBH52715.1 MFS transporter [Fluviispira sanaruensis]